MATPNEEECYTCSDCGLVFIKNMEGICLECGGFYEELLDSLENFFDPISEDDSEDSDRGE